MTPDWHLLSFPNAEELQIVREQCHQAIQNVSAIGRSFLAASEDDGQAYLQWDQKLQRLVGKWIETERLTFRSSFSFDDFSVYLVSHSLQTLSSLSLQGVKQTDAMLWLEHNIKNFGLEFSKLDLHLPYLLPEYATAKGAPFDANDDQVLKEMSTLANNTVNVLNSVLSEAGYKSKILCRPKTFDLLTQIITLKTKDPSTSKSISLGLSFGDSYYNEPYFFGTTWPYITEELPSLDHCLGRWQTDDWVGTVLPLSRINDLNLIQEQRGAVIGFFNESLSVLSEFMK